MPGFGGGVSPNEKSSGSIRDLARLPVRDLVDVDPVLVEEAAMEELHLERQLFAAPERALGQEADRAVMVVVEILQVVGQFLVGGLERLARDVARHLPHDRAVERGGFGGRGGDHAGHRDRDQRQRGYSKKISAVHFWSKRLMATVGNAADQVSFQARNQVCAAR